MTYNSTVHKKTNNKRDLTGTAVQLKKLINDIIDVTYGSLNYDEKKMAALKRFVITCSDHVQKTKLGYCKMKRDAPSEIVIYSMEDDGVKPIIITTIHEASHHIAYILHNEAGHGRPFYDVHKQMLFAAFDMGILSVDDVLHSGYHARNREKLGRMMDDYVPHPVEYKKDTAHISVYNAYEVREQLRERGYKWNPLEKAWVLESTTGSIEKEKQYLMDDLHIADTNISTTEGTPVIIRQRRNVYLREVQFDHNQIVKDLGYHWETRGKDKFWTKKITEDKLPEEETKLLLSLGIDIHTN